MNNQLGFWPSLQVHHDEVLQLLWNGWRISGCHLVLEDKSIQVIAVFFLYYRIVVMVIVNLF